MIHSACHGNKSIDKRLRLPSKSYKSPILSLNSQLLRTLMTVKRLTKIYIVRKQKRACNQTYMNIKYDIECEMSWTNLKKILFFTRLIIFKAKFKIV